MTPDLPSLKQFLLGPALDPFKAETRRHLALVTFMAWIGLGADGISSANYGPEEAFLALGDHKQMAIFLALLTGFTVFLIGAAYAQIIEIFPGGGGGYRVASTLLGPRFGLIAGSALLIDYVLTIAISIASGTDALFSLLPRSYQGYKLWVEYGMVIFLCYLNLRGMKESIKFLLPIFFGFLITHAVLILYGVIGHAEGLEKIIPQAIRETEETALEIGWLPLLALFFKAFSLGGGTYTGLEAVSNSMHSLAEPKVRTGKATMWCVAASLAFMAMGIILLYLLWDVEKVPGETLNATVFSKITHDWTLFGIGLSEGFVFITMLFAAGLLFVAANTGFIAGPAVLANLALDRWMPTLFSLLSSRLVTKNGILLMGASALGALAITNGDVSTLVILYSINVFLTFTLSLAGLTRYRWQQRKGTGWRFVPRISLAFLAFFVCASILIITLLEKFLSGGWITVLVTSALVVIGLLIHRHYLRVQEQMDEIESLLTNAMECDTSQCDEIPPLDKSKPTAIFLVSGFSATGIHTFLWVQRIFPTIFKNFLFISVAEINSDEMADQTRWQQLRRDTKKMLKRYTAFCRQKGFASDYQIAYGTDAVRELTTLTDKLAKEYPNAIFFATRLILKNDNYFIQLLHNQTAYLMQRRLHRKGRTLIILPMNL